MVEEEFLSMSMHCSFLSHNRARHWINGFLLVMLLGFSAPQSFANQDPLETINRKVFAFNDFMDRYLLKPVAKSYDWLTPRIVDDGISNVFDNLGEIKNFLNDLLQFKFRAASTDVGRFLINSTIGIAGIFDVATRMGLEENQEDFGQTLARWKVGSGPYIVLPFLGPSTLRDAVALIPDSYTVPQSRIDHVPTRNTVYGVDVIDTRSDLLSTEELIQGDKYTFIRDVYLQRREFLISDGVIERDAFTDDPLY